MNNFKPVSVFLLLISFITQGYSRENNSIVLLTTFSQRAISPIISQYQANFPEKKIEVIFRRTSSAFRLLDNEEPNIDLLMSSSSILFKKLSIENKLTQLELNQSLPAILFPHTMPIDNIVTLGYSGLVLMYNNQYLESHDLQIPKSWDDLTKKEFFQNITMSTPSRSGTTSLMVESILQKKGWVEGWKLLMKIGGNIGFISSRSFGVSGAISKGLIGAGPVIDSYAINSKKLFDYVDFNYLNEDSIIPTYIAISSKSKSVEPSKHFINFLLSKKGQKLVETTLHKFSLSDTKLISNGSLILDKQILYKRDPLVSLLFDVAIADQIDILNATWGKIHQLNDLLDLKADQKLKLFEAKKLASKVPVTPYQSNEESYLALFNKSFDNNDRDPKVALLIQEWKLELKNNLIKANKILDKIKSRNSEF